MHWICSCTTFSWKKYLNKDTWIPGDKSDFRPLSDSFSNLSVITEVGKGILFSGTSRAHFCLSVLPRTRLRFTRSYIVQKSFFTECWVKYRVNITERGTRVNEIDLWHFIIQMKSLQKEMSCGWRNMVLLLFITMLLFIMSHPYHRSETTSHILNCSK